MFVVVPDRASSKPWLRLWVKDDGLVLESHSLELTHVRDPSVTTNANVIDSRVMSYDDLRDSRAMAHADVREVDNFIRQNVVVFFFDRFMHPML